MVTFNKKNIKNYVRRNIILWHRWQHNFYRIDTTYTLIKKYQINIAKTLCAAYYMFDKKK